MQVPPPSDRPYDLVLYGATGFVGQLTAEHLVATAPDGLRIALAGRSRSRVEETRAALGDRASGWGIVLADADEPETLVDLAASTRTVASTVGPYARWGLPLVAACADAGTHYADLTGEVLFVHESIARYQERARNSGARIVHSCGFDSVPSDLGMLTAAQQADTSRDRGFDDATLVVVTMKGGLSGGTIDSMRTQLAAVNAEPELRRIVMDPYALSPDRSAEADLGRQSDVAGPHFDAVLGRWVAPFVMASYNTRVVRRSNALAGFRYGRRMRYTEVMGMKHSALAPFMAGGTTAGLGLAVAAMSFGPTRSLLDRVLPKPGEGPDRDTRERGRFRVEVHARRDDELVVSTVAATGDPGYQATSVMLGQSALALSEGDTQLPDVAGVLTPAVGLGDALVSRLVAQGFEFETRTDRLPGSASSA